MNITDIDWDTVELPWVQSPLTIDRADEEALALVRAEHSVELGGPHRGDQADLLWTIFAGQKQLMEKYREIEANNGCVIVPEQMIGELDSRQVQMRLKDLCFRMIEEITEATNCLKNKPWKNTHTATDRPHFEEEIADALHFFVELLITAGIDPDHLFKLYFLKHAVNQFRQGSNY